MSISGIALGAEQPPSGGGLNVGVDMKYREHENDGYTEYDNDHDTSVDDEDYGEYAEQLVRVLERTGWWLAAQRDAAERCTWLVGQGFELGGPGMLEEAVRCENTELVVELLGEGSSSSSSSCSSIGRPGGVQGGKEGLGVEGIPEAAVEASAGRGHLEMLRSLYNRGRRMGVGVLHATAAGGHLAVVQWLLRVVPFGGGRVEAGGGAEGQQQGRGHGGKGQGLGDAGAQGQRRGLARLLTAKLLTAAAGSGSRRLVVWPGVMRRGGAANGA